MYKIYPRCKKPSGKHIEGQHQLAVPGEGSVVAHWTHHVKARADIVKAGYDRRGVCLKGELVQGNEEYGEDHYAHIQRQIAVGILYDLL